MVVHMGFVAYDGAGLHRQLQMSAAKKSTNDQYLSVTTDRYIISIETCVKKTNSTHVQYMFYHILLITNLLRLLLRTSSG